MLAKKKTVVSGMRRLQHTLSDCRAVGPVGLSDCRTVGTVGLSELSQLSDLSDCRTHGRQWKTVLERGKMEFTVGMAVGQLSDVSDCRTVGLSDCRMTVG